MNKSYRHIYKDGVGWVAVAENASSVNSGKKSVVVGNSSNKFKTFNSFFENRNFLVKSLLLGALTLTPFSLNAAWIDAADSNGVIAGEKFDTKWSSGATLTLKAGNGVKIEKTGATSTTSDQTYTFSLDSSSLDINYTTANGTKQSTTLSKGFTFKGDDNLNITAGADGKLNFTLAQALKNITSITNGTQTYNFNSTGSNYQDNDVVRYSQIKDIKPIHYFSVNSTGGGNYNNDGATGSNAIAIGKNAKAAGNNSLAIGPDAIANKNFVTAIGNGAGFRTTQGESSVYLGQNAGSNGNHFVHGQRSWGSIYIGQDAGTEVTGDASIGIGSTAGWKHTGSQNIFMGDSAKPLKEGQNAYSYTFGNRNLIFGNQYIDKKVKEAESGKADYINDVIVIGTLAKAEKSQGIAIGSSRKDKVTGAYAKGKRSIAIGVSEDESKKGAQALGDDSIALGTESYAKGETSIAIGRDSNVTGKQSISIGYKNQVLGEKSGAFGDPSVVTGNGSYSFGNDNNISSDGSFIFGNNNTIAQNDTFVVGSKVTTTQANSVVLGNESTDRAATAETSATVGGITYGSFAGVGSEGNGVVSVGDTGKERQIINVAAGKISKDSTDAINGSQLYTTNNVVSNVGNTLVSKILGGNAEIEKTGENAGQLQMSDIGGTGKDTIDDAIKAAKTEVKAGKQVTVTDAPDKTDGHTIYTVNATKTTLAKKADGKVEVTGGTDVDGLLAYEIDLTQATKDDIQKGVDADTEVKKGLFFTGDNGSETGKISLGDKIALTGDTNIITNATGKSIAFSLNKDLTGITSIGGATGQGKITFGDNNVINANGGKITNVGAPTDGGDVTNKTYVDSVRTEVTSNDKSVTVKQTGNEHGKLVYDLKVDTDKIAETTRLAYKANGKDDNKEIVTLEKGLNFINGSNTVASIDKDGVVKYDLNDATKTIINNATNKDLNNLTNAGNTIISNIANKAVEVKEGSNVHITSSKDKDNGDGTKTTTYIVAADKSIVSVENTLKLDKNTTTEKDGAITTDYKLDLSQATKDSLAKADSAIQSFKVQANSEAAKDVTNGQTIKFINGSNINIIQDERNFTFALNKELTGINSIGGGTGSGSTITFGDKTIDVNGSKITNVGAPTDGGDVTNKTYVDSVRTEVKSTNGSVTVAQVGNKDGKLVYDLKVDTASIATNTKLAYKANSGTKNSVSLADGLNFVNGKNTIASVGADGNVTFGLKDDITLSSVTTGDTKVDTNGITITNTTDANKTVSLTDKGLNNGGNVISNVASALDKSGKQLKDLDASNADDKKILSSAATVGDLTKLKTNVTNNITNVSNILGDNKYVDGNGSLTEDGKLALRTNNADGRKTTENTNIIQAINNLNSQGTRFFHVNSDVNAIGAERPVDDNDSSAGSYGSISIGIRADVGDSAKHSISIGTDSNVTGKSSIAIGYGNQVKGNHSGAFGDPTVVTGDNAYSIGNNNKIDHNNTFVLGNKVTSKTANSVILGNLSTDRAATSETKATVASIDGKTSITYGNFAGKGSMDNGVVSVGAAGNERQVINVAAGKISKDSTDAINGSQLFATNQVIGNVAGSIKNILGGDANVTSDGDITMNDIGGTGATTIDGAIRSIKSGGTNLIDGKPASSKPKDKASAVANGKGSTAVGYGSVADGKNSVALGAGSNDGGRENTVSVGSKGNERTISNVAPGKLGTDAVNLNQLNQGLAGVYSDINKYKDSANAGIASAIALGMLPQSNIPGKGLLSLGTGYHNGESAISIGISKVSDNAKWIFKGGVSYNSEKDVSAGASVGFHF
ncbi:LbR_YadA-like and YadA_anchor domain-containing protein [Campylobacter blaseri]|uniref:Uncharacterized protein n=1 Tax=Campylobacter blaseri TaxID=2042961 RepID=A0A2P8QZT5_9BACT|nr:YadA-like family protein [Campylobacter blaseri]PSM51742.1 hypothetical protein CQ405_06330 [Campylobacter blaseri]PSM53533.1 hypothetical protein CRN67_06335 [Campylobacter blaseri]QKF86343.1 LbR_YadA-like and YadA_anchor domain-containing protein [Campylobacter blaseri]